MIYLLNVVSGIEIALILYLFWKSPASFPLSWPCLFLIFTWMALNLMNLIPWYGKLPGKLGIRLHLQKNIVPMVYILSLAFGLKLLGLGEIWLIPFTVLFLPIYYVSFILLYFHFKDDSKLPPSYFSHHFYLKDEES